MTTPPPVEDLRLNDAHAAAHLVQRWEATGGFTAPKVSRAASTLARTFTSDSTFVLTFPAAIISTGLRGVLRDLVAQGYVDAIVTTCGTLDHDIARTQATYRQGRFAFDDEQLLEQGYHRLGNVLVPEEAYGPLIERFMKPLLEGLEDPSPSGVELIAAIGEHLRADGGDSSLLAACARHDVPVFVPGLFDGAVGSQLWSRYELDRSFNVNLLEDQHQASNIIGDADGLDALMIGGGISKHHAIWWAQFAGGLDRAVYVTTAVEHDGSLSGARLREAISWSKLKTTADHVTIDGEATVIVPLLLGGALHQAGNG